MVVYQVCCALISRLLIVIFEYENCNLIRGKYIVTTEQSPSSNDSQQPRAFCLGNKRPHYLFTRKFGVAQSAKPEYFILF